MNKTSPIVESDEKITRSEKETFRLAKDLARSFRDDEVVFLTGDLGAGKTVMAKGMAAGLGLKDTNQVCSPTFTLLNIYKAKRPIFHIDLYRLDRESEILDLGWEDWLGEGVVIVEWAEKIPFDPGRPVIRISIRIGSSEERIIIIDRRGKG